MRILYLLTDGFGAGGGIAQFNRDLLRSICSLPEVSEVVAIPRNISAELGELPRNLSYHRRAARGRLHYALHFIQLLIGRRRIDLIICTHLNLQPLAALARWVTGAPTILMLHGVEAWTPPRRLIRRATIGYVDVVAAVSRVTLDRFLAWSGVRRECAVVLPCCVDLERFTPGQPSSALLKRFDLEGRTVILTLGRLAKSDRYKGFDEMMEILGRLRRVESTIVYVIAGAGDDRQRLEAKARELGVEQCVRFTGYVRDEEMADLYRSANVFVLAGYGEGFGIVLLEAMACGVPVVASTLDGSFEAVGQGKFGAAVDPRDRDALFGAVSTAMRRSGRERPVGIEIFSHDAFRSRAHDLLAFARGKGTCSPGSVAPDARSAGGA